MLPSQNCNRKRNRRGSIDTELVKQYAKLTGMGMIAKYAPNVLGSTFVFLFKKKRVDRKKAIEWVEKDRSLWDALGAEHQGQIKQLALKIGDLSWVDADWAIKSLRGEFPALASLFLGWRKGYNWLNRQLEIIKREAKQ